MKTSVIAFLVLAAALPSQPIRVSDKRGPAVLYERDPDYPAAALQTGIEGDVTLRIHITPSARSTAPRRSPAMRS